MDRPCQDKHATWTGGEFHFAARLGDADLGCDDAGRQSSPLGPCRRHFRRLVGRGRRALTGLPHVLRCSRDSRWTGEDLQFGEAVKTPWAVGHADSAVLMAAEGQVRAQAVVVWQLGEAGLDDGQPRADTDLRVPGDLSQSATA